jgi:hypothetical protein
MTSLDLLWFVRDHGGRLGLTPTDRLVLIMLAAYWKTASIFRASVEQLATATGLARSTVQRSLRRLERLAVLRRTHEGGGRLPNVYTIELPASLARGSAEVLPHSEAPHGEAPAAAQGGPRGRTVGHAEDLSEDQLEDPTRARSAPGWDRPIRGREQEGAAAQKRRRREQKASNIPESVQRAIDESKRPLDPPTLAGANDGGSNNGR